MGKICYLAKRFNFDHRQIIANANQIIDEYQAQGYTLTLRQLYYQFVARDLIANTVQNYKKLGYVINDARMAGLVDWSAIEDRTRSLRGNGHFDSPADVIRAAKYSYKIDMWQNQPYRVEVWVEKDALLNAVERVARRLDVNYFACRGYTSASEEHSAALRFRRYIENGQQPVVLYLGDHDPSGIDMTRDHRDRLALFGVDVEVDRLALNYDQIQKYSPPPNPTKLTDSRATGYISQFGMTCWELDALSPTQIGEVIERAVIGRRNEARWAEMEAKLRADQRKLDQLLEGLA